MANPTTNYGWPMPTSTDLVTDLPADFAAFGQPVDTTLKALNPETTLGDISYRSATSNTNTRLGIGTNGQVLAVSGGVPAWTTTSDVTPLTTKGDLFTFDTADARLAVGTNGQTLVADSSTATGLKWAAAAAGGTVVKVVMGQATSAQSTSTSTYADTGLTATITPTSATSKILVMVSHQFYYYKGASQSGVGIKLLRDATAIYTTGTQYGFQNISIGAGTQSEGRNMQGLVYLDSPATTSAITYKTQGGTFNTTTVTWQESGYSQIILMEIGA